MIEIPAPTVVSLFSGAGGLDIGLERAGWHIATATDVDKSSIETLEATRARRVPISGRLDEFHLARTRIVRADVRELGADDLRPEGSNGSWRPDLLVGGPPCQPWSSAGHQKGLDDPRGQLIAHMLRLISELQPRYVLFENVRGLVTAVGPNGQSGEVLRSIQSQLELLGYASVVNTLNAADYGAAQRRVRLVLLATSDHRLPSWPIPTHDRLPEVGSGVKPWVTMSSLLDSLPAALEPDIVRPSGPRAELLEALEPGKGLRTGGKVEANRPSGHWGYRQDSFLADPSLPARTVRAAATPDWIRDGAGKLRRLTWLECASLQGFPLDWKFVAPVAGRFRLIGNAVQADMAQAIGESLSHDLAAGPTHRRPETPPWPAKLTARVRYTLAEHRVNAQHRVRIRPIVD